MTKVLYEKQRNEHNTLELTPDRFQTILEDAKPQLVEFFDELYNTFIPETRSAFNRKKDKKKVVNICYSIVAIRNRLVNNYSLEIGLYLVALESQDSEETEEDMEKHEFIQERNERDVLKLQNALEDIDK
ncbi:26298_t:CDS:2, partial [Gigaspora rosea]